MTDPQAQACRRSAWDALFKVLESIWYGGPEARPSPEEEERMVAEMVRKERQARRSETGDHEATKLQLPSILQPLVLGV
jgi:hypothetical protein